MIRMSTGKRQGKLIFHRSLFPSQFPLARLAHASNRLSTPPTFNRLSHVILPRELAKSIPKNRLLEEHEWRGMGVQQSRGWAHYAVHR